MNSIKIRRFTRQQLLMTILSTFITGMLITALTAVKIFTFGGSVDYAFWPCAGTVFLIVMLLMFCLMMYIATANPKIVEHYNYYLAYMAIVGIVSIVGICLAYITPLLIPVAFASLLIFPLVRKNTTAFVINTLCTVIIFTACLFEYLVAGGSLKTATGSVGSEYLWDLFIMCLFSIVIGGILPYFIRYKTKRTRYIVACVAFNLATWGLITLILFINAHTHATARDVWMAAIAVFIPLISSLLLVPLIESVFNLITDNRLSELTDIKQPLIARLITEAPGTFNHSLTVANFAEICANAIGENPYLARAAAYYHDVGKLENPSYFAENQSGHNPLDELLPEVAAQIIRNHTENGFKLCERYRIPQEISRTTLEHHGTMPIKVFYERAKQLTDGEVDIEDYSYHAGKPKTKMSAIIMLCDSSEAAIRAMDMPDGDRVDALLRKLIGERVNSGQLDECDISLKELDTIRLAIIEAYGGLYHRRIKYPEGTKA